MHFLANLPYEIHDTIFAYIPQSTLAQLCFLDHQSYTLCLPHLYRHVRISIRRQALQLENGLRRSSLLRQVVEKHTKHLTLTSSQSSFQWLISNAQADWCRRWMPSLSALTFCDFSVLPVERVSSFLTHFVSLQNLCFRYCNLVCLDQPEAFVPMASEHPIIGIYQLPASYYYHQNDNSNNNIDDNISTISSAPPSSVSCLRLDWTDFSPTAIDSFLHKMPGLTRVFLGANHNRTANANTMALEALMQHCPLINTLKIALQQACPITLRKLITHYGPQLLQLDIQCQDSTTLKTVAKHAKRVEWLAIHAIGTIQQQQEDSDNDDGTWSLNRIKEDDNGDDGDDDDHRNSNRNFTLNRTTAAAYANERKRIELDGIEGIVQQCHQLIRMDMIGWGFCAIPSVILLVMAHRQKQQRQQQQQQQRPYFFFSNRGCGGTMPTKTTRMGLTWNKATTTIHLDSPILLSPAASWSEKTSLALDRETLADIRNMFA
ncbi:hypothetical protein BCR42DRAFT_402137 [Absidia repens]|uniref:F-box domain-containing protein n=1 Tax=Absidia repens TaxID=90262 RepID=A0A1X2IXL3_9FUNG|nr:hypothetical protein BCR42DRAFT_402137 [Absidia repens]